MASHQTDWRRDTLPKPEFLNYPAYSTEIDHIVLNASGLTPDATGPYAGRIYMVQGTILSERPDGQYEEFTAAAGQAIAGILYDTVEFAAASDTQDKAAAMVRRNMSFKSEGIKNFATHEVALRAALSTSEFT